ncbi:DNA repair protein RecN [Actinocatenispora rupis]|uniref:DNA repair protein RecN n=1 Tax=Actinocatenispora rupis TaxID=519421 RepID=A0A8J3J9N1_9ACTN|nr:DNA repair protein RecN [Actinocatenispora rupis]GID11983.1 DNA repair protein RecN [Actinocatenispora rupis]
MLEELRITGLGVIDDATLPLDAGLTVITGETGAGKTMVVAGLGLLFGGRADAGRVRADPGRAVIEGRLRCSGRVAKAVAARIGDAGAEPDEDGAVLLSRSVSAEGRSRAHVGGRSVPVGVLSDIGGRVLAVHGQSDQMRLLQPLEQLATLDRYAGPEHEKLLDTYREVFASWRRCDEELTERRAHARERNQQVDLLRLGLDEIAAVDPQPGEDVELRSLAQRLEHTEGLRSAVAAAQQALAGDMDDPSAGADASTLLGVARHSLESQLDVDESLGDLAGRVESAARLVADVSSELTTYLASLDADPAKLAEVHERRAALRALTRKYAEDVDGVLAWAQDAQRQLTELDSSDETLAALEAERDRLAADVVELAGRLGESRREASERFGVAVSAELAGLAMPHAQVVAHVAARPVVAGAPTASVGGEPGGVGPDGADEVELRLIPHPGAPALPVQRGASGGELSRVMLAVEVVFAGAGGPPTLVFDEVDAGVGGEAAVEIGRRLAKLARRHQVLVVTHLPQVAAFADRHLVVQKGSTGSVTTSGVRVVEDSDRARELARMLAGLPDSSLGVAHAEELLAMARSARTRKR